MDKKTLIKMTVPKLKEEALKIEGLTGIHGMGKNELLETLFEHYNIPWEKKKDRGNTADLKRKAEELRQKKEQARTAGDKKQVEVLRKRIHNLKRATR